MQFKNIIGQHELKKRLINMVQSGRISHAQLFLGDLGYGGLGLALAYAQYIYCSNKSETDSCGECPSCIKVSKIAHPDLHFSFPFNAKGTAKLVSINSDEYAKEWREIVSESPYFDLASWQNKIEIENKKPIINVKESQSIINKLSLKSYEADYKIMIIWDAEQMNVDAANKLLKLIEEPTDKTLIILIAENQENILQTILSRTQLIRVPPIEKDELKLALQAEGCDGSHAERFSRLAEGNYITAKGYVEHEEEDVLFFELFKTWMRACYKADIQAMHGWVEEASSAKLGREGRKRFLIYALDLMREGVLMGYTGDKLRRFYGDEGTFMENFAPFVHTENIVELMEMLNEAHYHIDRNAYAKIVLMDMSMRFANLLRVKKRTFVS